ncbi:response regulator [Lacihabitans lacunae]|jgi:DNA-binding response OmpR family regulator|uniref:PleD family two-component system response regulator n=1 Tax=Lacihabitans lacunae TaxID=1028214 RepID=A0ABV7YYK2_9BACT
MVILAADDQPIVLKSLTHILKESGFDVHGANNGQSAIDDFDTLNPDLVIIDIHMPVKSGFEVIEYIRNEKKSNIPIIIMSGINDDATLLKAFSLGADDFIEKPVGLNQVVIRVKKLLKLPADFGKA